MTTMHVDCASCQARPRACGDCVISVLMGVPSAAEQVRLDLDHAEAAALANLAAGGLVPRLRLVTPVVADEAQPLMGCG